MIPHNLLELYKLYSDNCCISSSFFKYRFKKKEDISFWFCRPAVPVFQIARNCVTHLNQSEQGLEWDSADSKHMYSNENRLVNC